MESNTEKKIFEINIVLWALDIDKANDLALSFLNSQDVMKNKNNFYSLKDKVNEYTINIYLRSPKSIALSAPTGITTILVIYLSQTKFEKLNMMYRVINFEYAEAKKYYDTRKKIPFKFFITEERLSESIDKESKNLLVSEFLNQQGQSEIINQAITFEKTLKTVFDKFDLIGNGLITSIELMKVSQELGHSITEDDAKMIIDTLDKNYRGSLDFEAFKRWWVLGRSDFVNFRRLCKSEIFMDDFIQKSSIKFNDYLLNIKNEGQEISQEELNQTFDIHLHPGKKPIENGIGFFAQLCNGTEALDIIETKFDEFEKSQIGIALKLKFDSNESAKKELPSVESFINSLICTLLGEKGSLLFFIGPIFKFKITENFIVIYYADKRAKPDTLLSEFKSVFSSTLHLFTELNIEDLLKCSFEEIIQKLFKIKVHFIAKMFHLKDTIKKILKQIEIIEFDKLVEETPPEKNNLSFIDKYFGKFFTLIRLYFLLEDLKFEFTYDSENLKEQFFSFIEVVKKQVDKEKEEMENFKYSEILEEEKEEFLIPEKQKSRAQKILEIYNIIDFGLCEAKEFFKEIKNDKEFLLTLFEEEKISFLRKIDLEEIILEFHSKSIITPIYAKIKCKIPKLNETIENIINQ